jgi:hypothetical protein
MTTEKQVTNYEEQMRKEATAIAKTERVGAERFTTNSGILSYMGEALPDNQMDVIVLASYSENVYYRDAYDSDNIVPPTCYALGPTGEPMSPHPDIAEPINDVCKTCDFMKFKSAPNKKGKACKEKRRLGCIPFASDPEVLASSEMAMLGIPVMSVKNWSVYVNAVSAKYQRPPWGMITRIKLVPDAKSQFRVTFAEIEPVDSELLNVIGGRIAAAKTMLQTPYELDPQEEEKEDEGDKKY